MKSDIDFALFAEQLVEQDVKRLKASGGRLINDPQKGIIQSTSPDISNVTASNDLRDAIYEQAFGIKNEKPKPTQVKKPVQIKEKTVDQYAEELMLLIKQAQTLINEMTSCGSIGVATIEPSANKKVKKSKKNDLIDRLRRKHRIR